MKSETEPIGRNKIALTGDRPTGPLHLGHYVGSLLTRLKLQEICDQYIMIADVQALTDKFDNPSHVKENVYEVIKDYLAVGIDPNKTTIFLQSQISEIAELTIFFLNLVSLSRLERNPTVKTEIKQRGYNRSVTAGFLCYPVSQAADITIFQAEIVPVGSDQMPMIEQTNEIVNSFNRLYNTDCLKLCEAKLSKVNRLVGIDGKAKASKSLKNAIFLKDDKTTIKHKISQMYTDPNHLKITDPGMIEGNVVFEYLDAFHNDPEEVENLKNHYKKGGLGDVKIKEILTNSLQSFLEPIYEKRKSITNEYAHEILLEGTKKAKIKAQRTMNEVRRAMSLDYLYPL